MPVLIRYTHTGVGYMPLHRHTHMHMPPASMTTHITLATHICTGSYWPKPSDKFRIKIK